jgi:hypothetical protein
MIRYSKEFNIWRGFWKQIIFAFQSDSSLLPGHYTFAVFNLAKFEQNEDCLTYYDFLWKDNLYQN